MKVDDKEFKEYVSERELDAIIQRLAEDIKIDYQGKNPFFLLMLNGAFIFAADLLRRFDDSVEMGFVRYTSYSGLSSTGEVKSDISIPKQVQGRDVIVIEDIIDTGCTMQRFLPELRKSRPKSVAIVALLSKPEVLNGKVKIDYVGKEIKNEFVVGYGLDYNGAGRNLKSIYVLSE